MTDLFIGPSTPQALTLGHAHMTCDPNNSEKLKSLINLHTFCTHYIF
jgi:hypothetical protein